MFTEPTPTLAMPPPLTYPTFTLPDLRINTAPVVQVQRQLKHQSDNVTDNSTTGYFIETEVTLNNESATTVSSAKHFLKDKRFFFVPILWLYDTCTSQTI